MKIHPSDHFGLRANFSISPSKDCRIIKKELNTLIEKDSFEFHQNEHLILAGKSRY